MKSLSVTSVGVRFLMYGSVRLDRLKPLVVVGNLALGLSACGGGSGESSITEASVENHTQNMCTVTGVYTIDLTPPPLAGDSCAVLSDQGATAQCIEQRILNHVNNDPSCLKSFGVFVPGTNHEDGVFSQFTAIKKQDPSRTYLSIKYGDLTLEPTLPAFYDDGVDRASKAINDLLFVLQDKFDTSDVRVYGHSKGAHAVADASLSSQNNDIQFYAFGQPGRTADSLRGEAGYITKKSSNLVTITWQNDEVKFYSGGANGFQVPEIWGWPGYVNQAGGGNTLSPTIRIDHHGNYGADYEKRDFPYCATGHKTAMIGLDDPNDECEKRDGVRYRPYFWGDETCTDKAYQLMESGQREERYYIGYSGPRAAGCKDTVAPIDAEYTLRYRMSPADDNGCTSWLELSFLGLDFGTERANGSVIRFSSTKDTQWVTTNRLPVKLPLHMNIQLWTYLKHDPVTSSKCNDFFNTDSEIYIDYLRVYFQHPDTGENVERTLIGLDEGQDYLWPALMQDANNVAWRKSRGTWNLHYGIPPTDFSTGAIMAKGPSEGDRGGIFYKWVHLLD